MKSKPGAEFGFCLKLLCIHGWFSICCFFDTKLSEPQIKRIYDFYAALCCLMLCWILMIFWLYFLMVETCFYSFITWYQNMMKWWFICYFQQPPENGEQVKRWKSVNKFSRTGGKAFIHSLKNHTTNNWFVKFLEFFFFSKFPKKQKKWF